MTHRRYELALQLLGPSYWRLFEEFGVTVHGRATPVDPKAAEHAEFRATLLEVYVPRYGAEWEDFLDSGPVYARIDAERMFTLAMD